MEGGKEDACNFVGVFRSFNTRQSPRSAPTLNAVLLSGDIQALHGWNGVMGAAIRKGGFHLR